MSQALQEASASHTGDLPEQIFLDLVVQDRDSIAELIKHSSGPDRDRYALDALKIGLLALRRASTNFDAEFIQAETRRLLESLRQQLDNHAHASHQKIAASLKEHFDPESGRFSERVRSLTSDNGDLARLLRTQIDGEDSRLAKTLLAHVGKESPLMSQLDPDQSKGLLATLRQSVELQLGQQRDRLLKEFSLDNSDSALSRLIRELTTKHGDLTKDLQTKIDVVVKEFSLDEENSALSRLVQNVDRAQRTITSEFSLDNENSALRRLKSELTKLIDAQVKSNAAFQEEVKIALGKLSAQRQEELRSTRHGDSFEDAVIAYLQHDAQRRGDIAEATGRRSGRISRCMVGDAVVQLSPESAAPGARIVVEAKEDKDYTIAKALTELEVARKNRDAQIGVFVFSKRWAPADLDSLARFGSDLVLVWDAEDPLTDVFFKAALEIARAVCVRSRDEAKQQSLDFSPIDQAILEIEKRVQKLDQIGTFAETIQRSSEKILNQVKKDQKALAKQLEKLNEGLDGVRAATTLPTES